MIPLSPKTEQAVTWLYAAGTRAQVRELLLPDIAGGGVAPAMMERIRFACMKLGPGDMDALRRALELANTDWRDLLLEADFDNPDAHEHWWQEIRASAI